MCLARRSSFPVPLYFKIMAEIRDNILSGTWSRGFTFRRIGPRSPTGVSVITVRQALAQLAREGLVRRERAKGTLVNWSGPVNQAIHLKIEAKNLVTLKPEGTSFKLLGSRMLEPGAAPSSPDWGSKSAI